MAREFLTDEQVVMEIERLKNNEHVKLAQKEIKLKNKQRQYLYSLRWLEKRGKQLEAEGKTRENLDRMIAAVEQV